MRFIYYLSCMLILLSVCYGECTREKELKKEIKLHVQVIDINGKESILEWLEG